MPALAFAFALAVSRLRFVVCVFGFASASLCSPSLLVAFLLALALARRPVPAPAGLGFGVWGWVSLGLVLSSLVVRLARTLIRRVWRPAKKNGDFMSVLSVALLLLSLSLFPFRPCSLCLCFSRWLEKKIFG